MIQFIVHRLLLSIVVLFLITLLIFASQRVWSDEPVHV